MIQLIFLVQIFKLFNVILAQNGEEVLVISGGNVFESNDLSMGLDYSTTDFPIVIWILNIIFGLSLVVI